MIVFEYGMDYRCKVPTKPTVARLHVGNGVYRFCIIGCTAYGYLRTRDGDVRTWESFSGASAAARKFIKNNFV